MWVKIFLSVILQLNLCVLSFASSTLGQQSTLTATFSSTPISFAENKGQWPDSILYRASADGATMWFTSTGVHHQITQRIPKEDNSQDFSKEQKLMRDITEGELNSYEIFMMKAKFVGSNANPQVIGLSEMQYKCNYFLGNDPDMWFTNVKNYESILYKEVYPGIDLKYYSNGRQMEYDFIVSPVADYSQIQIRYDSAKSLALGDNGELVINAEWGTIIEQVPKVYQIIEGRKEKIGCIFVITDNNTFKFKVDSRYDLAFELVIDPGLIFSTYLGGNDKETGESIVVNDSGEVYVTGSTVSVNFPTQNQLQDKFDEESLDVFVSRFARDGSLLFSTYLGGGLDETGYGITLDAVGNIYLTGKTKSAEFPNVNQFQTWQGWNDAFVTKLSSTGDNIIYSTHLGGSFNIFWESGNDFGYGIAVDSSGAAYVVGATSSNNFPTQNAIKDTLGPFPYSFDAFVTKLSPEGNSLIFSTYLGGGSDDAGLDIALDATGAAYVTGHTNSIDFPTKNAYQDSNQASHDAFVTKFDGSGDSLIFSTYIGGSGEDVGRGIALGNDGSVYITGHTYSSNYPILNPFQTFQGVCDAFVTKLDSSGDSLHYSTYLGGGGVDIAKSIAVDSQGAVYVTGNTPSVSFPRVNALHVPQGSGDAFVAKFASDGSGLSYSTYLGGISFENGNDVAVDVYGFAYVVGNTRSSNFPTHSAYQSSNQGVTDAFVTKIGVCCVEARGDANLDGTDANILDLTYLVDMIFRNGPVTICSEEADINNDGSTPDILDLTYLVDYIFRDGPPPGPC